MRAFTLFVLSCALGGAAFAGANPAQPVTTTPATSTLTMPTGGGGGVATYFTINLSPTGTLTFTLAPGGGGGFRNTTPGTGPVPIVAPAGTN